MERIWRISLLSLLRIIRGSSLDEIVLQLGEQNEYEKVSKICPLSSTLKEKYNEAGYKISDMIQNTGIKHKYVWCVISKK